MITTKKKNELFELVKGLDSSEKAYYKKLSKRHSAKNIPLHIKLFDIMDNASENDDVLFAKKLKMGQGAQYSGLKNYLWNDILAMLVYLKRNDSVLSQINFYIIQLEALINKSMIESAIKIYDKAWQLAVDYELFDKQIALLGIKNGIDNFLPIDDYIVAFNGSIEAMEQTTSLISVYHTLNNYYNRLMHFRKKAYMRFTEEQLWDIEAIRNELRKIENLGDSKLLLILKSLTLSYACHLSYDFKEAQWQNSYLLLLWPMNKHLIESHPMLFIETADITFYNDFALNDIRLVQEHIDEYEVLVKRHIKSRAAFNNWKVILFNTELKILHKTARYDYLKTLLKDNADYVLEIAKVYLPQYRLITLLCSLCISEFVLNNYTLAENYLQDIKDLNRGEKRQDVLYFCSLFQMLILFESKQWYHLNNAISATYLQLYNKKQLQPFEKEVMLFLKKLPGVMKSKNAKEVLQNFMLKLDAYKNDPVKKLYFTYFNYHGWLESKILAIDYREYISENIKQKA